MPGPSGLFVASPRRWNGAGDLLDKSNFSMAAATVNDAASKKITPVGLDLVWSALSSPIEENILVPFFRNCGNSPDILPR
jgi:hypothetical protein